MDITLVECPWNGESGPNRTRPWPLRTSPSVKNTGRCTALHAIDFFRGPRPDSVMSDAELSRVSTPTMFCLGTTDPFLKPAAARPSIDKIRFARLYEVQAGHGPWLDDPAGCAHLVTEHLAATGFGPAVTATSIR